MTYCDFDNYAETYREIIRKARKPHHCCECHGRIQPGERYHYISGIWSDSGPGSFHRCADCQHILCDIKRETKDEVCMSIGGLFEWLRDAEPSWKGHFPAWDRWAGALNALAAVRGGARIQIHERREFPYEPHQSNETGQQAAIVVQETASPDRTDPREAGPTGGERPNTTPAQ